ncbi:TIGR02646 family protein [Flavobacterium sp. CF108]|uniref:hypothetical protein n=1 Tax=unclassified Flavobacterium TaxID=196869 RepID=UPI0008ADE69E|nr:MULTISPECIES: hypothetical protein [unclassified Flavobacterium]SEO19133.1 TIGR02646 family protein [Flavobacterium sp. fv08]SHG54034.1 TIGR02646 family protein [Flavobacterium sp. CF108]
MISLERLRTASVIHAKYRGADKIERDIELMLARRSFLNDNTPILFNSAFWKTAKKQLKKESFGKCAYCEANTDVVAHGDVEHYRPKSTYWWLAYTYDNYLFACQICNQTYKSDNFPLRQGAIPYPCPSVINISTDPEINLLAGNISPDPIEVGLNYTLQTYIDEHLREQALLLNPYFDNPEVYFAYEADDVTQEVKIIPTQKRYAEYVEAAEDFYGINRIELKSLRYSVYKNFRTFKLSYRVLTDAVVKREVQKQIEDMLSSKYLFAGMNRYFDTLL